MFISGTNMRIFTEQMLIVSVPKKVMPEVAPPARNHNGINE